MAYTVRTCPYCGKRDFISGRQRGKIGNPFKMCNSCRKIYKQSRVHEYAVETIWGKLSALNIDICFCIGILLGATSAGIPVGGIHGILGMGLLYGFVISLIQRFRKQKEIDESYERCKNFRYFLDLARSGRVDYGSKKTRELMKGFGIDSPSDLNDNDKMSDKLDELCPQKQVSLPDLIITKQPYVENKATPKTVSASEGNNGEKREDIFRRKYCRYCGQKIDENAERCNKCGKDLSLNSDNANNDGKDENPKTIRQFSFGKELNHQGINSIANELRTYKQLLDEGVITQEDYDLKKEQILSKN